MFCDNVFNVFINIGGVTYVHGSHLTCVVSILLFFRLVKITFQKIWFCSHKEKLIRICVFKRGFLFFF